MTHRAPATSDAETWQPPPGMFKLTCANCGHYFASSCVIDRCPTCIAKAKAALRRLEAKVK